MDCWLACCPVPLPLKWTSCRCNSPAWNNLQAKRKFLNKQMSKTMQESSGNSTMNVDVFPIGKGWCPVKCVGLPNNKVLLVTHVWILHFWSTSNSWQMGSMTLTLKELLRLFSIHPPFSGATRWPLFFWIPRTNRWELRIKRNIIPLLAWGAVNLLGDDAAGPHLNTFRCQIIHGGSNSATKKCQ